MSELVERGIERLERVIQRLHQWGLRNLWWFLFFVVGLDMLSLFREALEKHDLGWRMFSLLFRLAFAVWFWRISRNIKKLEAMRRQELEGAGDSLHP